MKELFITQINKQVFIWFVEFLSMQNDTVKKYIYEKKYKLQQKYSYSREKRWWYSYINFRIEWGYTNDSFTLIYWWHW